MDQHQFQSDIDHTHVCRVGAWSISVWLPSALNLRSSELSRVFRMFRHLGWRSKCTPATTWGITTIPLLQNSAVVMMTVLSRQLWHRRWSLWQLPVPPVPTNLALRPFSGFREVWIPVVGGHCVWLVTSLQWRHNGELASQITTHCLLNRLLERRSKKTSKLRVTGLCAGNSPVTGEFPAQMASNAENISIWWRHHVCVPNHLVPHCTDLSDIVSNSPPNMVIEAWPRIHVDFGARNMYLRQG